MVVINGFSKGWREGYRVGILGCSFTTSYGFYGFDFGVAVFFSGSIDLEFDFLRFLWL